MNKIFLGLSSIYFLFIINSCASNEDVLDGVDGNPVLISTTIEPPGENCENGGTLIEAGNDLNQNGILDIDEVSTSATVCNGSNGNEILIETESEPIGANCLQGGSKISIGYDLNNNAVLDSNEVENVLYVCDGVGAQSDGKTYLILTGNISNEEASAKIASELGANTQFIWVRGTTQLTSLDLSGVTELVEIRIEGNSELTSLNLFNLKVLTENFGCSSDCYSKITNNAKLVNLNLESLEEVNSFQIETISIPDFELPNFEKGSLIFYSAKNLKSITLASATNDIFLSLFVEELNTLELPNLESGYIDIYFGKFTNGLELPNFNNGTLRIWTYENKITELSSLSAPNFRSGWLEINRVNIDELKLPALDSAYVQIQYSDIEVLEFPELRTGQLYFNNNPLLKSVSAPKLVETNGLGLNNNALLETINLSQLVKIYEPSCGLTFEIAGNNSLTTINLDNFITYESTCSKYMYFNNGGYSTEVVDYLLSVLAKLNPPLTNSEIYLSGNSSPSEIGLSDISMLESNGNTVYL